MLDPDVRRQLREVAEAATEVFPNVDRVFAGIFDPPTVLSLLDALDEADLLRRNFNTLGDVNRELAAERDALLADPAPEGLSEEERLVVEEAREAFPAGDDPVSWPIYLSQRLLAIIDRLSALPDSERPEHLPHCEQFSSQGSAEADCNCVPRAPDSERPEGERVPEGWRVEWRQLWQPNEGEDVTVSIGHWVDYPALVPIEDQPTEEPT